MATADRKAGRHRARRARRLSAPQGSRVSWGRGRAAGVGGKARQGVQGLDEGLGREAGQKRTNIAEFGYFGTPRAVSAREVGIWIRRLELRWFVRTRCGKASSMAPGASPGTHKSIAGASATLPCGRYAWPRGCSVCTVYLPCGADLLAPQPPAPPHSASSQSSMS